MTTKSCALDAADEAKAAIEINLAMIDHTYAALQVAAAAHDDQRVVRLEDDMLHYAASLAYARRQLAQQDAA